MRVKLSFCLLPSLGGEGGGGKWSGKIDYGLSFPSASSFCKREAERRDELSSSLNTERNFLSSICPLMAQPTGKQKWLGDLLSARKSVSAFFSQPLQDSWYFIDPRCTYTVGHLKAQIVHDLLQGSFNLRSSFPREEKELTLSESRCLFLEDHLLDSGRQVFCFSSVVLRLDGSILLDHHPIQILENNDTVAVCIYTSSSSSSSKQLPRLSCSSSRSSSSSSFPPRRREREGSLWWRRLQKKKRARLLREPPVLLSHGESLDDNADDDQVTRLSGKRQKKKRKKIDPLSRDETGHQSPPSTFLSRFPPVDTRKKERKETSHETRDVNGDVSSSSSASSDSSSSSSCVCICACPRATRRKVEARELDPSSSSSSSVSPRSCLRQVSSSSERPGPFKEKNKKEGKEGDLLESKTKAKTSATSQHVKRMQTLAAVQGSTKVRPFNSVDSTEAKRQIKMSTPKKKEDDGKKDVGKRVTDTSSDSDSDSEEEEDGEDKKEDEDEETCCVVSRRTVGKTGGGSTAGGARKERSGNLSTFPHSSKPRSNEESQSKKAVDGEKSATEKDKGESKKKIKKSGEAEKEECKKVLQKNDVDEEKTSKHTLSRRRTEGREEEKDGQQKHRQRGVSTALQTSSGSVGRNAFQASEDSTSFSSSRRDSALSTLKKNDGRKDGRIELTSSEEESSDGSTSSSDESTSDTTSDSEEEEDTNGERKKLKSVKENHVKRKRAGEPIGRMPAVVAKALCKKSIPQKSLSLSGVHTLQHHAASLSSGEGVPTPRVRTAPSAASSGGGIQRGGLGESSLARAKSGVVPTEGEKTSAVGASTSKKEGVNHLNTMPQGDSSKDPCTATTEKKANCPGNASLRGVSSSSSPPPLSGFLDWTDASLESVYTGQWLAACFLSLENGMPVLSSEKILRVEDKDLNTQRVRLWEVRGREGGGVESKNAVTPPASFQGSKARGKNSGRDGREKDRRPMGRWRDWSDLTSIRATKEDLDNLRRGAHTPEKSLSSGLRDAPSSGRRTENSPAFAEFQAKESSLKNQLGARISVSSPKCNESVAVGLTSSSTILKYQPRRELSKKEETRKEKSRGEEDETKDREAEDSSATHTAVLLSSSSGLSSFAQSTFGNREKKEKKDVDFSSSSEGCAEVMLSPRREKEGVCGDSCRTAGDLKSPRLSGSEKKEEAKNQHEEDAKEHRLSDGDVVASSATTGHAVSGQVSSLKDSASSLASASSPASFSGVHTPDPAGKDIEEDWDSVVLSGLEVKLTEDQTDLVAEHPASTGSFVLPLPRELVEDCKKRLTSIGPTGHQLGGEDDKSASSEGDKKEENSSLATPSSSSSSSGVVRVDLEHADPCVKASAVKIVKEKLRQSRKFLRRQIDFYFSPYNWAKDQHLRDLAVPCPPSLLRKIALSEDGRDDRQRGDVKKSVVAPEDTGKDSLQISEEDQKFAPMARAGSCLREKNEGEEQQQQEEEKSESLKEEEKKTKSGGGSASQPGADTAEEEQQNGGGQRHENSTSSSSSVLLAPPPSDSDGRKAEDIEPLIRHSTPSSQTPLPASTSSSSSSSSSAGERGETLDAGNRECAPSPSPPPLSSSAASFESSSLSHATSSPSLPASNAGSVGPIPTNSSSSLSRTDNQNTGTIDNTSPSVSPPASSPSSSSSSPREILQLVGMPLQAVASFPRIQALSRDLNFIARCVQSREGLQNVLVSLNEEDRQWWLIRSPRATRKTPTAESKKTSLPASSSASSSARSFPGQEASGRVRRSGLAKREGQLRQEMHAGEGKKEEGSQATSFRRERGGGGGGGEGRRQRSRRSCFYGIAGVIVGK